MTTEYLHPLIENYRKKGKRAILSRPEIKRLLTTGGLEGLTLEKIKDLEVLLSVTLKAQVSPEVYQTTVSRLWESGVVWEGVIRENNVITEEEGEYRRLHLSYCSAHFQINLEIKQA